MPTSDRETISYQIRSINVLSSAKTLSLLHGMIGLVIGILISISSLFNPEASQEVFLGPLSFILLPIMNFILGFLGGAFIAACYNFSVRLLGGIKMELSRDPLSS